MYDPSQLAQDPILTKLSVGPKMPLKKLSPGMGIFQVMHRPGQAPDKSKPWAVVNLQTGDINGRWHPSKEEALAQARALYARLGDKAKVHSEEAVHNAYFMFADAATLLADDGVKWIEAIAPKTYHTMAYGDVPVTPDKIDNFVRNVNANSRGQDIAINFEHGIDPVKGLKAAGWIKKARKNDRGNLEVAVDFTETAKQEVRNGEWKYFSLEWDDEWVHPDGIIYQDVVVGGALTNRPVAKGLMPINFSEIFAEKKFDEYTDVIPEALPDSAFMFIDTEGGRHLPFKEADGSIDCDALQSIVDFLTTPSNGNNWPGFTDPMRQMCLRMALGLQQQDNQDGNGSFAYSESKPDYEFAVWPTTYVDKLPDSAFLYIESGGKKDAEGKTVPRSLRHLPFKDANGKVDLPHVRNAIARIPQMTSVDQSTKDSLQAKARKLLADNSKGMSEEKELEHSQPGTGSPPVPRLSGSGADDADRVGGWRRNTPPYNDPPQVGPLYDAIENGEVVVRFSEAEAVGYLGAAIPGLKRIHSNKGDAFIEDIERLLSIDSKTRSFNELQHLVTEVRSYLRNHNDDDDDEVKFSEGGNTVGELTEKDLRELRNVLEVDDDAKIVEAVRVKFGEMAALKDAISASEQERIFSEQYPEFYAQHQQLMKRDRENSARKFSEEVSKLRKAEGFGLKTTSQGLSTTAREKLEEVHMKFSENRGSLSDIEELVKTIMNGGIVQFGEIGNGNDDVIEDIDTSGPVGVANARKAFAELVAKVQRENDGMDYSTALREAAKKAPDLAEAYKITLPA